MRHEEKYRITMNSRAEPEALAPTSVGRIAFLCGLSAGIGLLAGGAAWVLLHAIALLTNVLLFRRVGWTLPSFADLDLVLGNSAFTAIWIAPPPMKFFPCCSNSTASTTRPS